MARFLFGFLCLSCLLWTLSHTPRDSFSVDTWQHNEATGKATCFLCGQAAWSHSEQTRFLAATYEPRSGIRVPAHVSICNHCAKQYGWPLPYELQTKAVWHWQCACLWYVQSDSPPLHVLREEQRRILSIQLTMP